MSIEGIQTNRIELDMVLFDNPIFIENYKGLKISIEKRGDNVDAVLYLDSVEIMSTRPYEHEIALNAVNQCPKNGRCFIGGLGLGLVPLYLAESSMSGDVLIIERDKRVLEKIAPKITKYLNGHYPRFNFKIIEGDAYDEIMLHGMFDWILIDLCDGGQPEFDKLVKPVLNNNGVYISVKING